eukprot:TRINITY_DN42960_c0_g1_i4.p2 TRINITY_DN42960_c0_g1~~TRINITY_DN42960_c0_g1_i4.p2  ORF type:complete len:182 (-),score=5.19 TRINITY_DN42960_c0_g1_i4:131-676(-)
MFAVRWLLEDACSTLLVFPLSCAAGIKSAALMDAVTMNVVPSSWRGPLSVVVGGLVCLATGVVLSLPGRLLIEEDDVLGLADVAMIARYILLAHLASNVLLPRRSSRENLEVPRNQTRSLDRERGEAAVGQSGSSSEPRQLRGTSRFGTSLPSSSMQMERLQRISEHSEPVVTSIGKVVSL